MSLAIGIDFGTTKSYVSFINRNTNDEGILPRMAEFTQANDLLNPRYNSYAFGTTYQFQPVPTILSIDYYPSNGHFDIKVGLKALNTAGSSECTEFVTDLKNRTRSISSRNIWVAGREFPIEGLIGYYLWALKHYSKDICNESNKENVTITVPAQANSLQRLTMQIAARIAGFEGEVDIVEEPVAAFLYHRHMNPDEFRAEKPSQALVVDFGGGTCDVSVIQYQDGRLPIVVSRYMAYLGGETIDRVLLEEFWLRKNNSDFPLSLSIYDELNESDKSIVKAHARKMKEELSNGKESYKTTINGVGWNTFSGNLITPIVHRENFIKFLERHIFINIKYGENPKAYSSTLKNHLSSIIGYALENNNIPGQPMQIDRLILAGGSIKLPFIQQWVTEILKNKTNTMIAEKYIFTRDNNICIACGAAIHQLYIKHSKKKEWKGAVRPTLPWNIVLIHNFNREGIETEISLGKMGDILPIDATGYLSRSLFINSPVCPTFEKPYYAISTRYSSENMDSYQQSEKIDLSDVFGSYNSPIPWTNGIHVAYQINKHGVIEDITLKALSLFSLTPRAVSVEHPLVGEDDSFIVFLKKLQQMYKSKSDILQLRRLYIPRE